MSEWESIVGSSRASSYGSCIRSVEKSTTQYVKHYLEESDTLQGIALKYGSTTDELRRINKLYSTDTIFLRKYLLVPAPNIFSTSDVESREKSPVSDIEPQKEVDALSFLQQLDSKITAGKKAVKNYKFDEESLNVSSNNANSSTKYFKAKDYHKTDPKTIFSHSQNTDNDQLFQL